MQKLADIGMFEGLQNQANQNMMTQGMTPMSVFNVTDQLKSDFFQFLDTLPVKTIFGRQYGLRLKRWL